VRALALIDGEHYPEVVRDALASLPYEVVGAVMLGGGEKLDEGGADYGIRVWDELADAIAEAGAEVVVDLSDEPVVDAPRRFGLAARSLAAGLPYVGADFRLEPVRFAPLDRPALAVIGSGKRVGKTAVAGHVARLLAESREVVVVAMGRGGPPEPVVVETPPSVADLLALSRGGAHAASDYLEDAALARVVTVGARRCGGGLAGQPFFDNVAEAARIAAAREPDLVLLEGSGAAVPPVEAGRRILVAGASQEPEIVAGYLGGYRLLLSDLVVLTMCEEPLAGPERIAAVRSAIAAVDPDLPVVATVMRPRPVEAVAGRRIAFFSTAPAEIADRLRDHLAREHGAEVVMVSTNLARRAELRAELASAAAREAETFLVEIKAAAVDVVAEAAAERGIPLVFADNEVLPLPGEADLDALAVALADDVTAAEVAA
jgi:cyclic 2,3-diphosphoglycerate synthetase